MGRLDKVFAVAAFVAAVTSVTFGVWDHLKPKSTDPQRVIVTGRPQPIPSNQEQLAEEAFDMQNRLRAFRGNWSDAELKVRTAAGNQDFPMEQTDAQLASVDSEFSVRYRSAFAPDLLVLKAKLLKATPSMHSYEDYEEVGSVSKLLDVETDFSSLRSGYKRRISTTVMSQAGQ